jgi:hypothetical protein
VNNQTPAKIAVAVILLSTIGIAGASIWRFYANGETTGVCIYKGPAFYGTGLFGGTSSQGVPLRGIQVTAWRNSSYTPGIGVFAVGKTDRTGCFTFVVYHGWEGYLSYSYNGTQYTDPIQAGLILGDNLP